VANELADLNSPFIRGTLVAEGREREKRVKNTEEWSKARAN